MNLQLLAESVFKTDALPGYATPANTTRTPELALKRLLFGVHNFKNSNISVKSMATLIDNLGLTKEEKEWYERLLEVPPVVVKVQRWVSLEEITQGIN